MIAHQIWSEGSLSFAEARKGIFTVAPNGRTYASHEIGNTLFMLPVAGLNIVLEKALAHRQGGRKLEYATGFLVTLMPAIYCALTATLLYVLLCLFFLKSITAALCGSLASHSAALCRTIRELHSTVSCAWLCWPEQCSR